MNIEIVGRNVEVTTPMREHLTDKLNKLFEHSDQIFDIHVALSVEKVMQRVEAAIHLRGKTIAADAEDENMYKAMDAAVAKLDRQVIRHNRKLKDHHRREARAASL